MTLNVVIHRHNIERLERIVELARNWGSTSWNWPTCNIPAGRFAIDMGCCPRAHKSIRPPPQLQSPRGSAPNDYKSCTSFPIIFRHYPKACMNGWGRVFLTVAPDGAILPCQSAREIPVLHFPSVRTHSLNDAWFEAKSLTASAESIGCPNHVRAARDETSILAAAAARLTSLGGDPAVTDPVCRLSPLHSRVEERWTQKRYLMWFRAGRRKRRFQ